MEFALSESQQLLVSIAREFLDKRCPLALAPGGREARPAEPVAGDLWPEMASLGWPGLLVPPALGGIGGSMLDMALLVEEMGRAGLPGPYVASAVVATSALLHAASPAQQERLLPPMALGDRIVTLAIAEDGNALSPDAIRATVAVPGRLDGVKRFVKDAHLADAMLVVARAPHGPTLVLVDRDRPGVTLTPLETMSGERLFTVTFSSVEIRETDLVGETGQGWKLVTPALQAGALARSAEMVGAAQRVLDLVVEHAKVRVQSGRPIGSFQAIQHACADLLRNVEGARWIVRSAAWKTASGLDAAADVAMAKAWAGEACLAVARRAHQIFGAISYCEEHPLHLFHKRIHAASVDFGDAAAHLETVAVALGLSGEKRSAD